MKSLLLILIVLLAMSSADAQMHKAFLNTNGEQVDSLKATGYILYGKVSDTSWIMKMYLIDNTLKQIGFYKDQNLSIPNGKFIYYYKASTSGIVSKGSESDTINYIRTIGYYLDGVRTGL